MLVAVVVSFLIVGGDLIAGELARTAGFLVDGFFTGLVGVVDVAVGSGLVCSSCFEKNAEELD